MSAFSPGTIHPNPALYLSPEMVMELALGVDQPYDIAARYGLARFEFDKLQTQAWFGEMVARKREELHADGHLFSAKAAMMAEELFQELFKTAITGGLAHNLTLDLTKQLSEIGQLKPRVNAAMDAGQPRFQINIQVNGADAAPKRQRLDKVVEAPTVSISVPADNLPPRPVGFKVPDFDLRHPGALIGNATAQAAAVPTTSGQAVLTG